MDWVNGNFMLSCTRLNNKTSTQNTVHTLPCHRCTIIDDRHEHMTRTVNRVDQLHCVVECGRAHVHIRGHVVDEYECRVRNMRTNQLRALHCRDIVFIDERRQV
jgi:hypothetical protein